MRATIAACVVLATASLTAQSDQTPVFRSGVDVLEVDLTVVDKKGVPIRDLRAPDFIVTVDGQPRRVATAEFISDIVSPGDQPPAKLDPYLSNNTDRRPGRLIILAIDRNNFDTDALRGAQASVREFIRHLSPADRLGLVTIPPPGPAVDFTTNHAQVVDAVWAVSVGAEDPDAFAFRHPATTRRSPSTSRSDPSRFSGCWFAPARHRPSSLSNCDRDVEQDSMTIAQHLRRQASESVSSLAGLLKNLSDVRRGKIGHRSFARIAAGRCPVGGGRAGPAGRRGASQRQRAAVRKDPRAGIRRACVADQHWRSSAS